MSLQLAPSASVSFVTKRLLSPSVIDVEQLSTDLVSHVLQALLEADAAGEGIKPVPTFAAFCRGYGLTQSELLRLAQSNPDTVGRAYEYALDQLEDYIVQHTLSGQFAPAAVAFIAPNITRLKSKQTVETVQTSRSQSSILDEIEAARTVKTAPTEETPNA